MSVKLVSWNVNGIRAVSKKEEFWDWFDSTDADIINFQEVRATQDKIPKKLVEAEEFHKSFNEAEKKGYSGVATYSKVEPVEVIKGLGVEELDSEGRVLRKENQVIFPKSVHGSMNLKRLALQTLSECLMKARTISPGGATEPVQEKEMPGGDLITFM